MTRIPCCGDNWAEAVGTDKLPGDQVPLGWIHLYIARTCTCQNIGVRKCMNVDMLLATSIHIAIPLTSCDGHKLQSSQLSQALSRFCPADTPFVLAIFVCCIYIYIYVWNLVYMFLFPPQYLFEAQVFHYVYSMLYYWHYIYIYVCVFV